MARVFISYARADRNFARDLADRLTKKGHSVWWDWNLLGGEQFRSKIAQKLEEAEKVIVVWTGNSTSSAFVIDEASRAREKGKLVPVSISGAKPPLGFGDLHTIDFQDHEVSVEQICAALEGAAPMGLAQLGVKSNRRPVFYAIAGAAAAVAAITLLAFNLSYVPYQKLAVPTNEQAIPSFDCRAALSKAHTLQDEIICHDVELSKVDREMGYLYNTIRNKISNPNQEVSLMMQQVEWIHQRDQTCPVYLADLKTPAGQLNLEVSRSESILLKN